MTPPASSGRRDAGKKKHTPVMLQYLEAKERFPDALLFFRLGDFYEFFFEDAVRVSELLGLQLTSRSKGPDGEPIQPQTNIHVNWYMDYSHGVRFVNRQIFVDGYPRDILEILRDPVLFCLLDDEPEPLKVTGYGPATHPGVSLGK